MKLLIVLMTTFLTNVSAAMVEESGPNSPLRTETAVNWRMHTNFRGMTKETLGENWVVPMGGLPSQQADGNYAPVITLAGTELVYCDGFEADAATADNHWPFDGNANDVQGGENGTIVGGAGFVAGVPDRINDQAIDLDGSTQRVDIPLTVGTSLSGLTAVSFSAFINFDTIGETGNYDVVFMLRREAGGNHQIHARVFSDGSLGVDSRPSEAGSQASAATTAGLISTEQWHHIATVINVTARTIRLFVDGQFISEADVSASWGPGSSFDDVTSHAVFGADPTSATVHWLDGRINDARLYHRALDDAEVATLNAWAGFCHSFSS